MTGSLHIKNGKYYMVINYIDDFGKRKNKWISTYLSEKGNKKAAQAMLNRWLAEHEGCNISAENLMFYEYLENWFEKTITELQPSTIRGYREKLKNHIIPYFKGNKMKLTELRVRHLEDFYHFLTTRRNLSPQSVRHCHRIISKSLNDALRLEMILSNPASLARLPKIQKFEGQYLTYSQLMELSSLFDGHILQPLVQFISVYGLRRSEALGLCWDKVDFENNQFTICRTMIQHNEKNYLKSATKNASSCRTLPLTPSMRELLLTLKERRMIYSKLFPQSYAENDLVFVWEDGSIITPNYLTSTFHDIVKKSHLPCIRLHDLRHSAASNLISNGASIVDVQHWLGHSQPSTTLNFYAHTDSNAKIRTGEMIEKSLTFEKITNEIDD